MFCTLSESVSCYYFLWHTDFILLLLSLKVVAVCKETFLKMQFVFEPCVEMCSWILEIKDFVQSHCITSSFSLSDCAEHLLSFQSLTFLTCSSPTSAITCRAHLPSQLLPPFPSRPFRQCSE